MASSFRGLLAIIGTFAFSAAAQEAPAPKPSPNSQPPSVYDLPRDRAADQNPAFSSLFPTGLSLDLSLAYLPDYIYRGVDQNQFIAQVSGIKTSENSNFQFDGKVEFKFDKLPRPFIGLFANIVDSDPQSNFQELRPYFGAVGNVGPFTLAAGDNIYQYPDRSNLDTAEVWFKLSLDDGALLGLSEPLLSPYIYAAYDYDRYQGWYIEAGISHDFPIPDIGLILTPRADIAYVASNPAFALAPDGADTGFQHYEVGILGRYTLNRLLNIPQSYGQWSFNGFINYTSEIDNDLRAANTLWGGIGIQVKY